MLSASEDFELDVLELWGVGDTVIPEAAVSVVDSSVWILFGEMCGISENMASTEG